MIKRYSRPKMEEIFSRRSRFQKMLEVELLACDAQAELGFIPREAAKRIRERAKFDIQRIDELEQETRHDVVAFLTNLGEYVGEDARYIHQGMTSSDVLDTALALQLKEAGELILQGLKGLIDIIWERAQEFKYTPMIGRTHGVHAEPITFGLKLCTWVDELRRAERRLQDAVREVSVGKLSGAVGTYSSIDPRVEEYVCSRLGLTPALISTQIVQRDSIAAYLLTLATLASSLERFAVEVRHLHRTEVREVEEYFAPGQKGSSAMPHKRNPILCERISGLARIVRSNAYASLENVPLWHERDISHSSTERVIIPDTNILIDYMIDRFTFVVKHLQVFPDRMLENINHTHGLIFSQTVLHALLEKGMARKEAYQVVQRAAMKVWDRVESGFKEALFKESSVTKYLSQTELESCFQLDPYFKHVELIFQRLKT